MPHKQVGGSGFQNLKSGTLATWPPRASANGRYLVGDNGLPFLLVGDSPQPLFVNVSTTDALTYYASRQGYGVNTLWVNLLCADYTFGRTDGKTFDLVAPFNTGSDPSTYDLSTPNSTYFSRMDTFIRTAENYGIGFLLNPCETGGWLGTLSGNGNTASYNYGAFVGARYKNFPNIIWMNGNDFANYTDPTDAAYVEHVMQGIADNDPYHLQTIELMAAASIPQSTTSLDSTASAGLCTLNAAYSYDITYDILRHGYGQSPTTPTFLVEANYEGETLFSETDVPLRQRKQMWWTMTSGGCGHMFGGYPSYRLTTSPDWKVNLDATVVQNAANTMKFLKTRRWFDLVPDTTNVFLTGGAGTYGTNNTRVNASSYATAAVTADGHFGLVYTPGSATLTIAMSKMAGATSARWYDPTNNTLGSLITGSTIANSGTHNFVASGNNNAGDPDWVLVLEA